MMSRLDIADVAPVLVICWVCAALVPLGMAALPRSDRRLRPTRPISFGLTQWICWGCMFSLNGVALSAYDRGLTSFGLEILTIAVAALAMTSAVVLGSTVVSVVTITGDVVARAASECVARGAD